MCPEGLRAVMDVIGYGDPVVTKGLNMLYGPGRRDLVCRHGGCRGAHMILFTTGRGTPFGAPADADKTGTNSQLAERKKAGSSFDAGVVGRDH